MASVIRTIVDDEVGGCDITAIPTWSMRSTARTLCLSAVALAAVIRMPRSQVAHFHFSEGGSFVREGALLLLAARRGIPVAATLHGAAFQDFASRRRTLVSAILRRADLVTCLSEADRATAAELSPNAIVALLPNPVTMPPHTTDARETEPIVLFAGEIGHRKGVDVLVKAWQVVRQAVPNAKCMIVGPPTGMVVAEANGLSLHPAVGSDEIRRLMAECRCVALPSRKEAMPMTLLEAMAAARPFVSTNVGGIGALSEGGRLVPVNDDAALAVALVEMLTDKDAAVALGLAGRDVVARSFSSEAIGGQLRALYAGIC